MSRPAAQGLRRTGGSARLAVPQPAATAGVCVVCFRPTTFRCKKCKAVKYWFEGFAELPGNAGESNEKLKAGFEGFSELPFKPAVSQAAIADEELVPLYPNEQVLIYISSQIPPLNIPAKSVYLYLTCLQIWIYVNVVKEVEILVASLKKCASRCT